MQQNTQFRCPFEEKGRQEGTIIEVLLGEDKEERLGAMVAAYTQFYGRDNAMAIRFTLPPSVLASCSDIYGLKKVLIPYQAEMLAALLDYRLRPLLPYHLKEPLAQKFIEDARRDINRVAAATVLLLKLKELGVRTPRNMSDQAMWIETHFRLGLHQGLRNPAEDMIYSESGKGDLKILTMEPSSIIFHLERDVLHDRKSNKNCFSIVKCPFYPQDFGRYSENVEIVVAREADFAPLDTDLRKRIRARSNAVLAAHGVPIISFEDDVQHIGLWIPEYKSGLNRPNSIGA